MVNHELTKAQIQELEEEYDNPAIIDLKSEYPEIAAKFVDLPGDTNKLRELASELQAIIDHEFDEGDGVLMPIGSPAFMFIFAKEFTPVETVFIFAHSSRISQEKTVIEDTFIPDSYGSKTGKLEPKEVVKKSATFKHEFFFEI